MKKVIRKLYWNSIREENWINQLAAKGLSLCDYSWGRYVFEVTEPGTYSYRIELLEKNAKNTESELYLNFLEESGVEVVAHYWRWVYLRKKTADGPFALFSDNESRIQHLTRITRLYLALALMEISIGIANLMLGISDFMDGWNHNDKFVLQSVHSWNVFGGALCLILGIVFFFTLYRPVNYQKKKLIREKEISE
jgi:hypothetical protein